MVQRHHTLVQDCATGLAATTAESSRFHGVAQSVGSHDCAAGVEGVATTAVVAGTQGGPSQFPSVFDAPSNLAVLVGLLGAGSLNIGDPNYSNTPVAADPQDSPHGASLLKDSVQLTVP